MAISACLGKYHVDPFTQGDVLRANRLLASTCLASGKRPHRFCHRQIFSTPGASVAGQKPHYDWRPLHHTPTATARGHGPEKWSRSANASFHCASVPGHSWPACAGLGSLANGEMAFTRRGASARSKMVAALPAHIEDARKKAAALRMRFGVGNGSTASTLSATLIWPIQPA